MMFINRDFLSGGLIAVSVAIFFLFVRPEFAVITELRQKQSEYEKYLNDAYEVRIVRGTLLEKRDSISEEEWDKLETMVPSGLDETALLHSLGTLANDYGAQITSFNAVEVTGVIGSVVPVMDSESGFISQSPVDSAGGTGSSYRTLEFALDLEVSYRNLIAFLRELERDTRLTDVVEMTVESGGDGSSIYTVSVTGRNYWLE